MPTREPPSRGHRDLLLGAGMATVVLGVAMVGMGLRLDVPVVHPVPISHVASAPVRALEPVRDGHAAATVPPTGRAAPAHAECEAAIAPQSFVAVCTERNDLGRDQRRDLAVMALWQRGYSRERPVESMEQYPPETWAATPSAAPYD